MLAIEDEDKEIKELERKLGLRTDEKRKKRYLQRIEEEGLGLGIFDFLKDIETKAKMDVSQYKRADQEYKFNDPQFEVAIGASDVEDGADGNTKKVPRVRQENDDDDGSDQEGFDEADFAQSDDDQTVVAPGNRNLIRD